MVVVLVVFFWVRLCMVARLVWWNLVLLLELILLLSVVRLLFLRMVSGLSLISDRFFLLNSLYRFSMILVSWLICLVLRFIVKLSWWYWYGCRFLIKFIMMVWMFFGVFLVICLMFMLLCLEVMNEIDLELWFIRIDRYSFLVMLVVLVISIRFIGSVWLVDW